jgi:hypothetical protein
LILIIHDIVNLAGFWAGRVPTKHADRQAGLGIAKKYIYCNQVYGSLIEI